MSTTSLFEGPDVARIAEAEIRCGRYMLRMEWPVPAGKTDSLNDIYSTITGQFFLFVGDDFDSDGEPMDVTVNFVEDAS